MPFSQQISNINSIYHVHNNPTFEDSRFTQNHMHSTDPKEEEYASSSM
jgi:hypothetical protein